ncbi:MAG: transposase [candidate division WOR-3 bacterium]
MSTLPMTYSAAEYSQLVSLVKEFSCLHDEDEALHRPMRDVLRRFLELLLRVDLTQQLQAERYQRRPERTDYRNGSYHRNLVTSFGSIPQLTVPRGRKGGLRTKVFRPSQRRWRQVETFIRNLFLSGVSTRQTGAVLEGLLATRPSASTVSSICKSLEGEVKQFQRRPPGMSIGFYSWMVSGSR